LPQCLPFCQCPLTRLLSHHPHPTPRSHSLAENRIGDQGASALVAILKETQITNLECAAAPECLLFCQCPLTRLLSHHPHPTSRSQSRSQLDRRPGRLRARCHPQRDDDHPSRVRCCPIVFAFVHCQHPLTLPLPTFAAWATTSSAASISWATAPTPPRASPSCARHLREAP
jgi:hypothetical protein